MSVPYLRVLDQMLADGVAGLGEAFVRRQVGFVRSRQQPDGGFAGRRGGSDAYYTDFAVRILALFSPEDAALPRAAAYLASLSEAPADVVECFSRLNTARILGLQIGDCGLCIARLPGRSAYEAFLAALCLEILESAAATMGDEAGESSATRGGDGAEGEWTDHTASARTVWVSPPLPPNPGGTPPHPTSPPPRIGGQGGRDPHAHRRSEMPDPLVEVDTAASGATRAEARYYEPGLHQPDAPLRTVLQSAVADLPSAIQALQRPDGGFAGVPGEPAGQTNATAAAAAFLTLRVALSEEDAARAAAFLAGMQAADGGLRAHAAAPAGDLLSTFTGLLTLFGLDDLQRVDVPAVARFVRASAAPGGGFTAGPADTEADVEYTYYGVGTLALLRLFAEVRLG